MTVQRTGRFCFGNTYPLDKDLSGPACSEAGLRYPVNECSNLMKSNHAIRWKVIYPVDSVIHLSHNLGLVDSFMHLLSNWGQWFKNPRPCHAG